jgi:hypothetical protein
MGAPRCKYIMRITENLYKGRARRVYSLRAPCDETAGDAAGHPGILLRKPYPLEGRPNSSEAAPGQCSVCRELLLYLELRYDVDRQARFPELEQRCLYVCVHRPVLIKKALGGFVVPEGLDHQDLC